MNPIRKSKNKKRKIEEIEETIDADDTSGEYFILFRGDIKSSQCRFNPFFRIAQIICLCTHRRTPMRNTK